jgi:hypothetical protein
VSGPTSMRPQPRMGRHVRHKPRRKKDDTQRENT